MYVTYTYSMKSATRGKKYTCILKQFNRVLSEVANMIRPCDTNRRFKLVKATAPMTLKVSNPNIRCTSLCCNGQVFFGFRLPSGTV